MPQIDTEAVQASLYHLRFEKGLEAALLMWPSAFAGPADADKPAADDLQPSTHLYGEAFWRGFAAAHPSLHGTSTLMRDNLRRWWRTTRNDEMKRATQS
eukprot:scaffold797_cov236-Pinguiococcus_pyrenoidosus.AAC.15